MLLFSDVLTSNGSWVRLILDYDKLLVFVNLGLYWGPSPTPRVHDCIFMFLKNEYRNHVNSLVNFITYQMEMHRDDLDVSERIQFIVCVLLHKCLHDIWPKNDEQSLSSTAIGQLDVTHLRTSTYGRRAFSFASPSAWNSLPNYLKDSSLHLVVFKRPLKTFCFSKY